MQYAFVPGTTGAVSVDVGAPSPIYIPVTNLLPSPGAARVSALIEIPQGYNTDGNIQLAFRYFATDNSDSASPWTPIGPTQNGPGKTWVDDSCTPIGGMSIQLGLRVWTSAATTATVVEGLLRHPILLCS